MFGKKLLDGSGLLDGLVSLLTGLKDVEGERSGDWVFPMGTGDSLVLMVGKDLLDDSRLPEGLLSFSLTEMKAEFLCGAKDEVMIREGSTGITFCNG